MKIDLIRLTGRTSVDLPIIGADSSGPFVLKGSDGLGPVDVSVKLGKTTLEKAVYQGKSAVLRQVTVLVGLQPEWDTGQTAEELRTMLYGLLTPRANQMVRVGLYLGGVEQAFAQGQVSKMEPSIFSKDPAVQIVIDCDYGYLLQPTTVNQTPLSRDGVVGTRDFDVENEGTAPSGFVMGVVLQENVGTSLILAQDDGQQFIQIDGINWLAGDKFLVNTRPGQRGVWRGAAGGAYVSCLNYLNASISSWIYLYGGENTLNINATDFDWDPFYNFAHVPAFWGV